MDKDGNRTTVSEFPDAVNIEARATHDGSTVVVLASYWRPRVKVEVTVFVRVNGSFQRLTSCPTRRAREWGNTVLSPEGDRIAIFMSGFPGVEFFDTRRGELIAFNDHFGGAYVATSDADGNRLASIHNMGGQIVIWDFDTGNVLSSDMSVQGKPTAIALSRECLAIATSDGRVGLFSPELSRPLGVLRREGTAVKKLRFSENGKRLLALSVAGEVFEWASDSEPAFRQFR